MSDTAADLIRIGDLARRTGKTVRAIHLYEELGLLRPATRSSGGFRLYESTTADRVRWIDLLHGMGFSLGEMHDVLQAWWSAEFAPDAMDRLRGLFQRKLAETREAVERHRQLEGELLAGLSYLETCKVCPTHDSVTTCVRCEQDHGTQVEPALLKGLMTDALGRERPRGPRRAPAGMPGFVPLAAVEGAPVGRSSARSSRKGAVTR